MSALAAGRIWRWGNGSLALLFVLSLLLFSAWRWHPEAWLRAEINSMARRAGVGLQYRALHLSGLSLRLDGVDIESPGLPFPIRLAHLTLRPAWLGLLSGHPGARVSARWQGQALRFSVTIHGALAQVHVPDTHLPIATFKPWWQRMLPLSLGGDLELHGDAGVALADGRPVHGQVDVAWQHASAGMAGRRFALGSFHMQGRGKDGRWRFGLSGGDQARLEAQAHLVATGSDVQAWRLQAQGQLSASAGSPLAGMMGAQSIRFTLAGPVTSPRWHMVSP